MTERVFGVICLIFIVIFHPIKSSFGQDTPEKNINVLVENNLNKLGDFFQDFTNVTGIAVEITEVPPSYFSEKNGERFPQRGADIFLTKGIENILLAERADAFEEYNSALLEEAIPEQLREPDGKWYGFSYSPIVILYNKGLVNPMDLLTYRDLANSRFQEMICVRPSSAEANLFLLSSLIELWGESRAMEWAQNMVKNFARKPMGGATEQVISLLNGGCAITLINHSEYQKIRQKEEIDFRIIGLQFPNQISDGSFADISGGGILKGASNPTDARRLMLYLTSLNPQVQFAGDMLDYPINSFALKNNKFNDFKEFKLNNMNLFSVGENMEKAKKTFEAVGWN